MTVDEQVQRLLGELHATTDYARAVELLRLLDGFGLKGSLELLPGGHFTVEIEEPFPPAAGRNKMAVANGQASELSVWATRVPIVTTRGLDMLPEEAERAAVEPDLLHKSKPYVFRGRISNDQLDAYHTRMHSSSLRNYAQDSADGVALQNSHRSEQLPFGYSFRGHYYQPHEHGDGVAKTTADFYVVPHLQLSDVSNDHLIQGIKSGTVRDLSVGFYGGRYRCTLCGRDMLRDLDGAERCDHVPGLIYRVRAKDSGQESEETAASWVHDARLAEVSTVYDGATPGATILKAKRMAEAGRLNWQQARLLESRYRMRLPAGSSNRFFAGVGSGQGATESAKPPVPRMSPLAYLEYNDGQARPLCHPNECYMG